MSDKPIFDSKVLNDVVDIYAKPEITVKKLKADYYLEFRAVLEGKAVDTSVVNAIRQTVMESIPVYGINPDNIEVDHLRCNYIYNNNQSKVVFCALTIPYIDNDFDLENPDQYLTTPELKKAHPMMIQEHALDDKIEPFEPKPTKLIELTLSYKNTTPEPAWCNTHDIVLKIDGKVVDNFKRDKYTCILGMHPGDEVHLRSTATLGIAQMGAYWNATTQAIHKEITSMKFELSYESKGQLHQDVIFKKGVTVIKKKLQKLHNYIDKERQETSDRKFDIKFKGLDSAITNVLSTTLQKTKYVRAASSAPEHMFDNKIIEKFILEEDSKLSTKKVLLDTIKYLIKVYEELEKAKL